MWDKLQTHGDRRNDAEVLAIAAAGAPLDIMAMFFESHIEEMFNLPGGEFPGNEDVLFDLRWSVIPRREGGIEVFGGNDGKIVLESEEEVKDLCEAMIRQIRAKPIFSDSGEPLLDCQSERRAAEPDLREGGQSEDQN